MMYPSTGRTANQLQTLDGIGMLTGNRSGLTPYQAIDDTGVALHTRGKAYLHVNCANCHQPNGPGRGALDARYETAFADMSLCNATPELGDMGVPGATLFTPTDPASSVVYLRMSQQDNGFMPPLASTVPDSDGATLLWDWITSVNTCP